MTEAAPSLMPHEQPLSPRADLGVAAVFFALSLAIVGLALRMPRFEDQGGEIYTAPGLVPSFYGVVLATLSLWLAARSLRRLRAHERGTANDSGNSNLRLALATGLGLIFVIGLIGRMPFWLAVTIFVALFIAIFEWRPGLSARMRAWRLGSAGVQAVATGIVVTLVFEKLFLVRLP